MFIQHKVTRKGAKIESIVLGKNAFRRSEYIVAVLKKETASSKSKYSVEIITTSRIGNDMDWGNTSDNHWTGYQKELIEQAGAHLRGYGHIVWDTLYSTYEEANTQLKEAFKLGVKLTKTPEHIK
jgi:hypothetical protein